MAQHILSRLGMFGAHDPVAEIDADLRRLTEDLKACQVRGETAMAERVLRWIDGRLDERISLTVAATEPGSGRHRAPADTTATADSQEGRSRAQID